MEIFRILSGILHLGNVQLEQDKAENSYVPVILPLLLHFFELVPYNVVSNIIIIRVSQ